MLCIGTASRIDGPTYPVCFHSTFMSYHFLLTYLCLANYLKQGLLYTLIYHIKLCYYLRKTSKREFIKNYILHYMLFIATKINDKMPNFLKSILLHNNIDKKLQSHSSFF